MFGRYKWLVFLLPILFLGFIVLDNTVLQSRTQTAGLPDCDDSKMVSMLNLEMQASFSSPEGNPTPVKVVNPADRPGDTAQTRTCRGEAVIGEAEPVPIEYEFQAQEDGEYAISFDLRS